MMCERVAFAGTLAALAAALAISVALPAHADDRALAKQHFDRALEHLKANELEPALTELETAQRLHPHFAVLYNIGQVYAALGKPDRAVDHLERYLHQGGEAIPANRREEVKQIIAEQAKRVGRVTFKVTPEGASVELDGRDMGTSPIEHPVLLTVGRHELVARRSGYRREQRVFEVEAGSRPTVTVELSVESTPAPIVAPLEIDCKLPSVTLSVDGRRQAKTPVSTLALPVGRHELAFERAGYAPSRHKVLVEAQANAVVRCHMVALDPLPVAHAGRVVVTHADVQLVKLDGEPLREDGRVPTGRHRLEVFAQGYRPWSRELTVRAGQNERIEPDLEPDADRLRAQQSQRTAAYALGAGGIALLGLAGGIYLWNDSRYGDWKREKEELDPKWQDPNQQGDDLVRRQVQNDELYESIEAFDNAAIGLSIAGAALFGTGVVLYLTGDDPRSPSHPVVAAGPRGSTAGWSFAW